MRRSVGLGALLSALLVVACGEDGTDRGRDSPNDDAGSVDGGELDGGLDASHTLDANIGDSATKPDASYYVNDAGETVQECAKSSQCPTGYRCEQDGARKACVFVEGFGESSIGGCAPGLWVSISGATCLINECEANPSICPSGSTCCSDGHISWCLLTACPGAAYAVPE